MRKGFYLWVIVSLSIMLCVCTFAMVLCLKRNSDLNHENDMLYKTNHRMAKNIEILEKEWIKGIEDLKLRNDSAEARINRFHKILE